MTGMSDEHENTLIDFEFRNLTYTPPTAWYVGLLTAGPTDSSSGTEVSGGAYARVAVTCNTTNWAATNAAGSTANPSAGTSGTTSNNGAITFPAPSGANWGTCTHLALFTAASGGNPKYYSALTSSKTINDGDAAPVFAAGALTIQLDD